MRCSTFRKLNIQKTKIMASDHSTSWKMDGERLTDFFFWGGGPPKSLQMVTAAMKLRMLDFWKKVMTNLDSVFKSRDITFLTKVHLVKLRFLQ